MMDLWSSALVQNMEQAEKGYCDLKKRVHKIPENLNLELTTETFVHQQYFK